MIQLINLTPQYPNQTVNFFANNQRFTLGLRWLGYETLADEAQQFINRYLQPGFYASIVCNNVDIIDGAPVVNNQAVNQYPSSMIGYIVCINFIDTEINPSIELLNNGIYFYYIDNLSEIQTILSGVSPL